MGSFVLTLKSIHALRISLIVVLASVLVGTYIGQGALNFQSILFAVLALGLFLILLAGHKATEFGGAVLIIAFAIGYRTIEFGSFRLHPLLLILGITLISRTIISRRNVRYSRPRIGLTYLAAAIWLFGFIQGLMRGRALQLMLSEAINVAALVPIYFIFRDLLVTENKWRSTIALFYVIGGVIAVFGIAEYLIPDLGTSLVVGLIAGEQTFISGAEGFVRAAYAFYGAPVAAFVCMLALPAGIAVFGFSKSPFVKLGTLILFFAQLIGVYISGYRSVWLITLFALLFTLIARRNLFLIGFAAVLVTLFAPVLPQSGFERLDTIVRVIANAGSADHSIELRYERAFEAIQAGLREPLGVGWGGSGWVHSDIAQFVGNLGIGVGLVVVGGLVWLMSVAVRTHFMCPEDGILTSLLGSLVGAVGLLVFQGVQVLPQLALPVWFVLVIVYLRCSYLQNQLRPSTLNL